MYVHDTRIYMIFLSLTVLTSEYCCRPYSPLKNNQKQSGTVCMKISANKHTFKVLRKITRKIEETTNKFNSQLSSYSRHFEAAKRSLSIQHIVAVNPEQKKTTTTTTTTKKEKPQEPVTQGNFAATCKAK